MAIALVTGNITFSGGSATVGGSGPITISPAMTTGQYLVAIVSCGATANISGTNLQLIGSVTQQSAASTVTNEFSLLRSIGTASSFGINLSTAAGLAVAAAVFSSTQRLRIDTSATGTATSASVVTTVTATTSQANELWVGGASHRLTGGATYSVAQIGGTNADNTYQNTTTIGATTDRAVAMWYRSVSATGAPNATITANASGVYCAQVVCLEETPAAGGGGGLRAAGHGGLAA